MKPPRRGPHSLRTPRISMTNSRTHGRYTENPKNIYTHKNISQHTQIQITNTLAITNTHTKKHRCLEEEQSAQNPEPRDADPHPHPRGLQVCPSTLPNTVPILNAL